MVDIKKTVLLVIFALMFLFSFLSCAEENTRAYLTTANWYPASKSSLEKALDHFFSQAKTKKIPGKITALIGPHAGFAYSGQCAANVYKQLETHSGKIERVFLLGVSHRGGFSGACVSGFAYNATPLGKIPVDREITSRLAKEKYFMVNNRVMQYEHSLENHLPFLQKALGNSQYKIVPILFGYLQERDFEPLAAILKKHMNEKTLIIASTDFTHYGANFGYAPFKTDVKKNLTELDMGMIHPILQLDFKSYYKYKQRTGITMCGFAPVGVLMNLFSAEKHKGVLVDYYKSGDNGNDYSTSVSYAGIVIAATGHPAGAPSGSKSDKKKSKESAMELSKEEKKTLLAIARESLETYVKKNKFLEDVEKKYSLTEKLKEKAGVFVTLKIKEDLRGCIGTIVGVSPVYQAARDNAVKSGVKDPRFPPVKEKELKRIHIEISVMTPLQKIEDYKKIRLGTDGVIIKKMGRQAVFLPQVATETGWNLDQFLSQLCRKAWLPGDSYKSPGMEFYIFQALVFGEKDLK